MIQTAEAVIDTTGRVQLLGEVHLTGPRRALVTVLEEPAAIPGEAALLTEPALAVDWSRPDVRGLRAQLNSFPPENRCFRWGRNFGSLASVKLALSA